MGVTVSLKNKEASSIRKSLEMTTSKRGETSLRGLSFFFDTVDHLLRQHRLLRAILDTGRL